MRQRDEECGRQRARASPRADDGLPDVPDDETPREEVARLRVEESGKQARAQFVRDLASFELRHANAIAKLRLRCTNLENANAAR